MRGESVTEAQRKLKVYRNLIRRTEELDRKHPNPTTEKERRGYRKLLNRAVWTMKSVIKAAQS